MERITKFFGSNFKSVLPLPELDSFLPKLNNTSLDLKIWPPTYAPSWHYYQIHQANYWSATEHEPLEDVNGFIKLDPLWQNALLQSFAVLAIGDDAVMRYIDENNLEWEESSQWMFKDQGARETIHKIVYNKMLHLADHSSQFTVNMLTSAEYVDYILGSRSTDFKLAENSSEVLQKAAFLIKMIFCERYLFATPFLIINLMGESGLINNCVRINMQVMKDEHVHYLHAVQLLHDLRLGNEIARSDIEEMFVTMAQEFVAIVETMIMKIGLGLEEKYLMGFMDHSRFTLQTIYTDCGVTVPSNLADYVATPFMVFDKNTGADKFNLMESNSIVYKAVRAQYLPDWDNLRDEEADKDVQVECKLLKKRKRID